MSRRWSRKESLLKWMKLDFCSLKISPFYQQAWMITNLTTQEKWGIEIKSPLSKVGMRVEDACKSKTFFLEKLNDGTIRLKRNHDYYIQVQGQLYVATDLNIESIHVIVYFGEEMPLFKEKILMESLHWNQELLPRHEFFFQKGSLS